MWEPVEYHGGGEYCPPSDLKGGDPGWSWRPRSGHSPTRDFPSPSAPTARFPRQLWDDPRICEASIRRIVCAIKTDKLEPGQTYNRYHIATDTTGYNFCWFYPRRTAGHCPLEFRVTSDTRDSVVSSLQEAGIDASPRRAENVTFSITAKGVDEHTGIIKDVLGRAEEASRL